MTNGTWTDIGTIPSPLDQANTTGVKTFADSAVELNMSYQYRVLALNTVGYGGEYPAMTVQSISDPLTVSTIPVPPTAPANLVATAVSATQVNLSWADNAINETGFDIERCSGANCTNFARIDGVGANVTTYSDTTAAPNTTYSYRVAAFNLGGTSQPSNVATVTTPNLGPVAPSNLNATILLN